MQILLRLILLSCIFSPTHTFSQTIKFIGNLKFDSIDAIEGNFIIASLNGKRGAINEKEIIQIPFKYDSIKSVSFRHKTCSIRKNGLWGIYNFSTKSEVVPCKYEAQIQWHNEKYMAIVKDNKWAIYNFIEKKYVTDFMYDGFDFFDSLIDENPEGYGITAIRGNIYYKIDKNGNETESERDSEIAPAIEYYGPSLPGYLSSYQSESSGFWLVQGFNKKYGLVDKQRKLIIDTLYDKVRDRLYLGIVEVVQKEERCYFDEKGRQISPFSREVQLLSTPCGSLIVYKKDRQTGCNNLKGELKFMFDNLFFEDDDQIGFVENNNKYFFIDCNGNSINSEKFDGIKKFKNIFLIKKNKFWQLATLQN
jgi:WG containing repeat